MKKYLNMNMAEFISQLVPKQATELGKYETHCEKHGRFVEAHHSGKCMQCRDAQLAAYKKQQLEAKKIQALNDVGYGLIYRNAELIPLNDHQSNVVAELTRISVLDRHNIPNIILSGKRGTGKTHLSAALSFAFLSRGLSVTYVKFYNLLDMKIHEYSDYKKMLGKDVVVIDEFGVADNVHKSALMHEIIDKRYENQLSTILLTNLSLKEVATQINDAMYSRLKSNIKTLILAGNDVRNPIGIQL